MDRVFMVCGTQPSPEGLLHSILMLFNSPTPMLPAPAAYEFGLRACTCSERPPHYVLVTVPTPPGAQPSAQQGRALQARLQEILDAYRSGDIAAARERQEQSVSWGLQKGKCDGCRSAAAGHSCLYSWKNVAALTAWPLVQYARSGRRLWGVAERTKAGPA